MLVREKLRPFESVEEMDEAIIDRWNEIVKRGDVVYHLGDVSFYRDKETLKILNRLNGQIRLIEGNHDHFNLEVKQKFHWLKPYYQVKSINGHGLDKTKRIILCHYPFQVWDKSHIGTCHLFGHCHGRLVTKRSMRRMDVCVEDNNYYPWSYDVIRDMMQEREPTGHHPDDPRTGRDENGA